MGSAAGSVALAALVVLAACQRPPRAVPDSESPDARVVRAFLDAYGRRDLEGMMRHLSEDAVFRGSNELLTKPRIRAFFQSTFQKYPRLRVEAGPITETRGTLQVRVRVETDAAWSDTWIFELRDHRIRAYGLASGRR